jgi:(2R)-ethylmalonyl-CoA mutase
VVLSKDARARAVQLPAWNEALGLPRPWDQQWSLRLQQIVAHETDILDYDDIFEGSGVIAARVAELSAAAREELAQIERLGGAVAAVATGYMKAALVGEHSRRIAAIESGERTVVGVNDFTTTAPSPLSTGDGAFLAVDPGAEAEQIARLAAWRAERDGKAAAAALDALRRAAKESANVMEPSIACAHAGVTTGEWAGTLREIFGEYRAPTGVAGAPAHEDDAGAIAAVRARTEAVSARIGRRIKLLVAKPGLDGHSNGAEQIAVRARDCGLEVVYEGIRLTPAQIANSALEEAVHVVGLSILSGSHRALAAAVLGEMKGLGVGDIPVIVGGIIPEADAAALKAEGVVRIYTPKDFALTRIIADIVELVDGGTKEAA